MDAFTADFFELYKNAPQNLAAKGKELVTISWPGLAGRAPGAVYVGVVLSCAGASARETRHEAISKLCPVCELL
jgi:hypothetical protein